MKKFIWTVASTVIITVATVYGWDHIVVEHFGFYNYPEWIAYALVCFCAYAGGVIGNVLGTIDWNFKRWKRTLENMTRELP